MLFNNCKSLNMNGLYGNNYLFGSSTNILYGGMNSIWGANGCNLFTNCNGTINYDSMAGFALGGALFNTAFMALGSIIQHRKETPKPDVSKDVSNIQALLNAELEKLGVSTPKEAAAFTVESEYTVAVDEAETAISTANTRITTLAGTIEDLKEKRNALDTNASDYANKKDLLDTQIKEAEAEKKELEKSVKKGGELYEALETARNEKEAREKEIKKIQAKIADYADKLAGAKEKLEAEISGNADKILDNADGKKRNRTSITDLKTKYIDNTSGNFDDVSIQDVRGAIYAYRTCDPEEKANYARLFNQLWDKINPEDKTTDIRKAREIIPK